MQFHRQQYICDDVSLFSDSEMFIFVDETGSDRRNALRKYGRGKRLRNHILLESGENAIACMHVSKWTARCKNIHWRNRWR